MSGFCSVPGCELSSYHKDGDLCFFHLEKPAYWKSDDKTEASALLEYLNLRATNSPDLPHNTLEIRGIYFDKRYIDFLRNSIGRPIKFSGCEFETAGLFCENHFKAMVEIEGCRWPTRDGKERLFRSCVFEKAVRVSESSYKIFFDSCEFSGNLKIDFGPYTKVASPAAVLDGCRFLGSKHVAIRCNQNYSILNSSFECKVFIDGHAKKLHAEGLTFASNSTIGVDEKSDLLLASVYIYNDMLIAGGYAARQAPSILFDGIHQFNNRKIIFENLDLSNFRSPTFQFSNVEFHGVKFKRHGMRSALRAETDLRTELKKKTPIYPRAISILEGLKASYTNIKLSYDRNADYKTANDFHASELWAEWKLQRIGRRIPVRALKCLFSWHTWYYLISNFGQSILRPFWGFLIVSSIAILLYSWMGIIDTSVDAYGDERNISLRIIRGVQFALKNVLLRFSPSTQEFVPLHHYVGIVAGIQVALSLICATFFVLALRRRFKR